MAQPIPSRIPFLLCALMPLLLLACAAQDRRRTPGYVGREWAGKTLAFIPPDTAQVEAGNAADIRGCFPREGSHSARAILSREFTRAFMAGLDRHADFVKPVLAAAGSPAALEAPQVPQVPEASPSPDTGFSTYRRPATGTLAAYTYIFPSQGRLAAGGVSAELALVVGRLKSMSAKVDIVAPQSSGALQQPFLVLEGQYLLWDYAAQKPVGYGRFRSQVDHRGEAETRDWMQAFDKAVKQVMEASPFGKS